MIRHIDEIFLLAYFSAKIVCSELTKEQLLTTYRLFREVYGIKQDAISKQIEEIVFSDEVFEIDSSEEVSVAISNAKFQFGRESLFNDDSISVLTIHGHAFESIARIGLSKSHELSQNAALRTLAIAASGNGLEATSLFALCNLALGKKINLYTLTWCSLLGDIGSTLLLNYLSENKFVTRINAINTIYYNSLLEINAKTVDPNELFYFRKLYQVYPEGSRPNRYDPELLSFLQLDIISWDEKIKLIRSNQKNGIASILSLAANKEVVDEGINYKSIKALKCFKRDYLFVLERYFGATKTTPQISNKTLLLEFPSALALSVFVDICVADFASTVTVHDLAFMGEENFKTCSKNVIYFDYRQSETQYGYSFFLLKTLADKVTFQALVKATSVQARANVDIEDFGTSVSLLNQMPVILTVPKCPPFYRPIFDIIPVEGFEINKLNFDNIKAVVEREYDIVLSFEFEDIDGQLTLEDIDTFCRNSERFISVSLADIKKSLQDLKKSKGKRYWL